jgi:hypothetical protein
MKKPSNLKMLLTICSLIVCFSFLISSHAQAQFPMSVFNPVMYFTPPAPGTTPTATTGLPSTFMPTVPTYGGLGTPWGAFGFLNPVMPTFGGLGAMPGLGYGGWLGTPPTTTGLTGWFGKATISPTSAPVPGLMTPGFMPFPVAPTGTSLLPTTPFGLMAGMPSFAGFASIMPFVPPLPIAPLTPTSIAAPIVPPTVILPPPTAVLPPPTVILPPPSAVLPLPTAVLPPPTAVIPPPVIPTVAAPTAII